MKTFFDSLSAERAPPRVSVKSEEEEGLACITGACQNFIPVKFTGYNKTFTLEPSGNTYTNIGQISNFCFSVNGGYRKLNASDTSDNFTLNNEKHTFQCRNIFDPTRSIIDVSDTYVEWQYGGYMANNLDELTNNCLQINGNHPTITGSNGNTIPLYDLSERMDDKSKLVYNCRNYWLPEYEGALSFYIRYVTDPNSVKKVYPEENTSAPMYETKEGVMEFCKTNFNSNNYEIKLDTSTSPNKYTYRCTP